MVIINTYFQNRGYFMPRQWDEESAKQYIYKECLGDKKIQQMYYNHFYTFYPVKHSNQPEFPSTRALYNKEQKEINMLLESLLHWLNEKTRLDEEEKPASKEFDQDMRDAMKFLLTQRYNENNIIFFLHTMLAARADAEVSKKRAQLATSTHHTVGKKMR